MAATKSDRVQDRLPKYAVLRISDRCKEASARRLRHGFTFRAFVSIARGVLPCVIRRKDAPSLRVQPGRIGQSEQRAGRKTALEKFDTR